MKNIFNNALLNPIYSINLKGKVKQGVKDYVDDFSRKFEKRTNEKADKLGKIGRWFTDNLTKEDVENFLGQMGVTVKVGALKRVSNEDGALWKVLAGNYKNKNYYGYYIRRNGNDIRIVHQAEFKGQDKQKDVLDWYKVIDPDFETINTSEQSNEQIEDEVEKNQEIENDSEDSSENLNFYETDANPDDTPNDSNPDDSTSDDSTDSNVELEGEEVIGDYGIRDDDIILNEDDYTVWNEGDIIVDKDDYEIFDEGDNVIVHKK